MLKKLTAITTGAAAYLSIASQSFAQVEVNPCPSGETGGTDFNALCQLNANSIGNVITTVVTVLLIGATLIALFFLIFGGIRWVTSGGDKGKVESARGTIIAAIIGLIIAFLAYFILALVLGFFGLDPAELKLPTLTK